MRKSIILVMVLAFGMVMAAGTAGDASRFLSVKSSPGGAPMLSSFGQTDNPAETLHYDGDNGSAIGLTGGGTFRGAVRFTPTRACTVKSVLFYQNDPSDANYIFIYDEGTDTTPGAVVDSVSYPSGPTMTWRQVNLVNPVVITAGTDFWAAVQVSHDSGYFPLGTDLGPMVRDRGGFLSRGSGWDQLADVGLDYNWNIRAVVEPIPGLAHDVGVTRIVAPARTVQPGSYTPKARITNFGETAESDIPVTCQIDSAGTLVYDETYTYPGPLAPGARVEVTFTPDWTTGPPLNDYDVMMFTDLSGDLERSNDTMAQVTHIAAVYSMLDHDTGYCLLSVSCFGSIGYDAAFEGNGFKYPKNAASALFLASFAMGNSIDYVADRHFGSPPTGPQNADLEAVDSLIIMQPPLLGDEHFTGSYDDAGHAAPKGLKVTQNTYMSAQPGYDDFVVLVFDIENLGASEVTNLYAGTFADFDVGADPASNTATTDTIRRFTYMRQASSMNPTVGIKILEPESFANLTAIYHPTQVYPDSCMTDAQKFRLMDGTTMRRNSHEPNDWSIITSAGPVDLPVGATWRFAVAFVGGISPTEALAHADSAQSWYTTGGGLFERPGRYGSKSQFRVVPNPFRNATSIHYYTPVAGLLSVRAFDAAGRMVASREMDVDVGSGVYQWQTTELARGVYFLTVRTPDGESSSKVLRVE